MSHKIQMAIIGSNIVHSRQNLNEPRLTHASQNMTKDLFR